MCLSGHKKGANRKMKVKTKEYVWRENKDMWEEQLVDPPLYCNCPMIFTVNKTKFGTCTHKKTIYSFFKAIFYICSSLFWYVHVPRFVPRSVLVHACTLV